MNCKACLMGAASMALMGGLALSSQGAALDVPPSTLDSRTIPHGDWVQVSGEIQHTMKVRPEGDQEQLMAMLQPVEGGQIVVDLGPAANLGAVHLQDKDYIHVRGTPLQQGETMMIVAGEIIADGKMIPIQRETGHMPSAGAQSGPATAGHATDQFTPSRAAPSPRDSSEKRDSAERTMAP